MCSMVWQQVALTQEIGHGVSGDLVAGRRPVKIVWDEIGREPVGIDVGLEYGFQAEMS